jgi:large subunit ribosomal protein L20
MEAIFHAGSYAFEHRRDKKGDFRRLWNVRLGAALKANGISYSKFIPLLKNKGVALDRKILSELAEKHPQTLKRVIESVK